VKRLLLVVTGGCVAVLIGLIIAVTSGALSGTSIDQRVAASSHRLVLHHHLFLTAARDITFFGSPLVVDVVTLVVAVVLLLRRRRRDAALVIVVRLATWALTNAIKAAVDRPRPHFATAVGHFAGSSFPSGHASGAASVYLPLAAVAVASIRSRYRGSAVLAGAVILCVVIGTSRVLLGAHYLSDVIAGLALGGAVMALCWATARQGSGLPASKPPDGPQDLHK
jgi:undecaprenyl-diphosphatase